MRTPTVLAAALSLAATSALAQPGPASPGVRETAGCAAVFMVMGQMATNPQTTGGDPLTAALGGMFGRSFTQKGRGLYARAAEQARRDRQPPEAVFEAGVGYLIEAYNGARAQNPTGQLDASTEAARLVERCVALFPDPIADF